MFKALNLLAMALVATVVSAAKDDWSHAELHYGEGNEIEKVNIFILIVNRSLKNS